MAKKIDIDFVLQNKFIDPAIMKDLPESKKIPIQCRLCKYNFQNEYCQINEEEDDFLGISECGEFKFCPLHLVIYLEEMI